MSSLILNGTRIYHTLSGDHDEDYFLNESDMSQEHWALLMSCHHQGACDEDAEEAAKYFEIKDYVKAVNWLIDAGIERDRFLVDGTERCTSRDQIKDEDAVLQYYLWLLAGDIQERPDSESEL
jgi:hypothetical protein